MPYADNNGVRIHYEVEGQGPPLVLHHGFAGWLENWYDTGYVGALKDDYQLILLDARGHGASDKPHEPEAYGLELMSRDVLAVMEATGTGRAHFWGFSMGGRIGFAMHRFFPTRLQSLIIAAAGLTEASPDKPNPGREQQIALMRQGHGAWLAYWEKACGPWWSPEMRNRLSASDLEAHIAQQGPQEPVGLEDTARTMALPCLVYAGERDPGYAGAKRAAEIIPGAVFVSFPGLGHVDVLGRKDLIVPHIRQFLAGLGES